MSFEVRGLLTVHLSLSLSNMEKINKNLLLLEKKKKKSGLFFFVLAFEFDLRVETYACPRGGWGPSGYVLG